MDCGEMRPLMGNREGGRIGNIVRDSEATSDSRKRPKDSEIQQFFKTRKKPTARTRDDIRQRPQSRLDL